MGIFGDDKKCVICNREAGLLGGLTGTTLADGSYLCSDCSGRCVGKCEFEKMKTQDVRDSIAAGEANKRRAEGDYHATRTFSTGRARDVELLTVDENHGWLMSPALDDGWVYDMDDIYTFSMDLEFEPLERGEKYDLNTEPFPELPKCPEGARVSDATLTLRLLENAKGTDKIEVDLIPAIFRDLEDVRSAYACAHDFFEFMRLYRTKQRKRER